MHIQTGIHTCYTHAYTCACTQEHTMYIYTWICTCTHRNTCMYTHMHTCMHTWIHTMHIHKHVHIHVHGNKYINACTYTHAYTCAHTHMHAHRNIHMLTQCIHTFTYIHKYTCTYIHEHIHDEYAHVHTHKSTHLVYTCINTCVAALRLFCLFSCPLVETRGSRDVSSLSLVWQRSVTGYLQLRSCQKSSKPRSHQNCSRRSTPVLITFFPFPHVPTLLHYSYVSWGYTIPKNRVYAFGFMASNSCSWTLEHLCAMLV